MPGKSTKATRDALEPFEREFNQVHGAYQVQKDLQEMMQHKVGIVQARRRNAGRARKA